MFIEDNNKTGLKQMSNKRVDWIHLAQDGVGSWKKCNTLSVATLGGN
jgi:hypothetical protein